MATFSVFYSGFTNEWWHVMTILFLYTLVHCPKTLLCSAYLKPTSLTKPGIHCFSMSPWLCLVWNVIYLESYMASSFLISFIQLLIFSMCFYTHHGLLARSVSALISFPMHECNSTFIHSPTRGHISYFQVWEIMNKVAIAIYVEPFEGASLYRWFGSFQGVIAVLHSGSIVFLCKKMSPSSKVSYFLFLPVSKRLSSSPQWLFLLKVEL